MCVTDPTFVVLSYSQTYGKNKVKPVILIKQWSIIVYRQYPPAITWNCTMLPHKNVNLDQVQWRSQMALWGGGVGERKSSIFSSCLNLQINWNCSKLGRWLFSLAVRGMDEVTVEFMTMGGQWIAWTILGLWLDADPSPVIVHRAYKQLGSRGNYTNRITQNTQTLYIFS